jgi:hypothetical protein
MQRRYTDRKIENLMTLMVVVGIILLFLVLLRA